ncbi:MAG TPA: glycosyltransferase family 2 protein [bacterium]|nr:glycosyltransferase family 2 protein [bacterium]
MPIELSVIAPLYNEEEGIAENTRKLLRVLKECGRTWELILVNDGSTDGSLGLLKPLAVAEEHLNLITYPVNRGRGYALRQGFAAARGRFIVTTESDLSWGEGIIEKLYRALKETGLDVVIASPYKDGGRLENIPFKRAFLSRFGNKLLSASVSGDLTMLSGMTRGYRREVIQALDLESDRKEIHLEIAAKCLALGYRVGEIPAVLRWEPAVPGKRGRQSKFHSRRLIFSHLAFSFYQKPMLIFGAVGLLMVLGGIALGVMFFVQFLMRTLYPARPIYLLMVILLVAGIQMLSFGFLANQMGSLKRDIYRLQRLAKSSGAGAAADVDD